MTPEEKMMMGHRAQDSDGFTYSYGKFKFNRSAKNKFKMRRLIRNDKRSVKAKELNRIFAECEE